MRQVLLVGAGGFIGSILRFWISIGVQRLFGHPFPVGILCVNTAGCLLVGWLGGLAEQRGLLSVDARLFLLLGVLGGFTTFSTFGYDTLRLMRVSRPLLAAGNVALNVGLGLAAVWLGWRLAGLGTRP